MDKTSFYRRKKTYLYHKGFSKEAPCSDSFSSISDIVPLYLLINTLYVESLPLGSLILSKNGSYLFYIDLVQKYILPTF